MKTSHRRHLAALLLLLLLAPLLYAQGTFPPTTAPAVPIMKTLTQIEPRTPIPSGTLATTYNINQSGSYYLTGNITVTADIHAISVSSGVNDVTIDLNGCTIESTYGSAGTATAIKLDTSSRIRIHNGIIKSGSTVLDGVITPKGFANGIYAIFTLTSSHISGVQIVGVGGTGIYCDSDSLVEDCQVSDCANGIVNPENGTTRNSLASNCADTGIQSMLVESCQGTGYSSYGISCTTALNSIGTSAYSGLHATTATNCTGSSSSSTGLDATTATNCKGTSSYGTGLSATDNATNCKGTSSYGTGLSAITASTCTGYSVSSTGLSTTTASNCSGNSSSGTGLSATTVTNCTGNSSSGNGLTATNATNCTGTTYSNTSGIYGLYATGTANTCQGIAGGTSATALRAGIAIGCTYSGGALVAPRQYNM